METGEMGDRGGGKERRWRRIRSRYGKGGKERQGRGLGVIKRWRRGNGGMVDGDGRNGGRRQERWGMGDGDRRDDGWRW